MDSVIGCMQTLPGAHRELKERIYEEKTFTKWLVFCLGNHSSAEHLYFMQPLTQTVAQVHYFHWLEGKFKGEKGKISLSKRENRVFHMFFR